MIGGIIQVLFIMLNVENVKREMFLIHMADTAAASLGLCFRAPGYSRDKEVMLMDIPRGYKELEKVTGVYISDCGRRLVICGSPDDDDEDHNCDHLGCSSVSHVLMRVAIKS